jgi:hypothetical protein
MRALKFQLLFCAPNRYGDAKSTGAFFMKQLFVLVLSAMTATTALAQREALIDHTDRWNLNSRFDAVYAELDGDGSLLGGLSVGGLLNDRLGVGLRGRVLLDDSEGETAGTIDSRDFWYAGGYVEYVSRAESLAYWSVEIFAGSGEVDTGFRDSDFLVIEPAVNLWVNITETTMLGLGVSYLMVEDLDLAGGVEDDIYDGLTGNISLRFTQF